MLTHLNNAIEKAKKIRLAIFDVDGVLTTGVLGYGANGLEYKEFHVHDGQGIKFLKKSGVEIGIITACKSKMVTQRMQDLEITHVYQGSTDKMRDYEDLKLKLNLHDEQIAYMGDDLPDLALIQKAGLGITVPNAPQILQIHADWITTKKGGKGAARELCELVMNAQETYIALVNSYLYKPIDSPLKENS